MITIKFKNAAIRTAGASYVVTIPKAFVENGLVDATKTYDVDLTQHKEEEDE